MNVLVITGDKTFEPGHERYELQHAAVDRLEVVYWGRGSLWPQVPEGKFDVVTVQDPFVRGLFAWRVARRLRARFNVQVHADLGGQAWWKRLIARVVVKKADSIRVVSQKVKTQVERMGGRNSTVLPVYVDVPRFRAVVRRPHEGKNILWVGRFEDEKDPLLALRVLKEVLETMPDTRLIMLGAGSMKEELESAAHGLPVRFPGWQDAAEYLADADVVLSTSRAESFGASIVEALAVGVPVVALDVGVAKEAGAIVVPHSELAHAVVQILKNPPQAKLTVPLLNKQEWVELWKNSL
jgi:glycosyltransferase involved in cell wall biosynthesis